MHRLPLVTFLLLHPGCALFKLATVQRSHPQPHGPLPAAGIEQPVQIHRDILGVPHIRAASERDALFALGFVHAQDRLFQADLSRHLAWGRTAEWFGVDAAELDVHMQLLGLRERASLVHLDAPVRDLIAAYVDGMNSGIESLPAPPIEYRLLGIEPEPWVPEDTFALLYLQSWTLQDNSSAELAAWQMRDEWDAATLDKLFRLDDRIPPVDPWWDTLRQEAVTGELTTAFRAFTNVLGGRPDAAEASNNWVIGPSRTASGMPILANDPHLLQGVPSLWYIAELSGGDLHVAGASLPGVPGIVVGHNGAVAWGLTNVMADLVDYAVLERSGDDSVIIAGERVPLERVDLSIRIDDGSTLERTAWRSPIGPVVTQLTGTHVLVQRWHALELQDHTPEILLGFSKADTFDDAAAAHLVPSVVSLNVAIGDVHGNFGYQGIGSVPRRRAHTGRVPYPASDPSQGWDGWLPALPGEKNPERGYAHTANARPSATRPASGAGAPIDVDRISTSWVPPHRFQRIDEVLSSRGDWTTAQVDALQRDVLDITARALLPTLLEGASPSTEAARTCLEVLASWNFEMRTDLVGPTVWATFQEDLLRVALEDELSERGLEAYLATASDGRSLIHGPLLPRLGDVVQDVDTALHRSCTHLEDTLGPHRADWTWGSVHRLHLQHPFARGRAILRGWNMPPAPFAGSGTTVAAASFGWGGGPKPVGGMASLRLVVPLDAPADATLVHPGGQSGQPRHATFRSHYDAFVTGGTAPLWFDEEDVRRSTTHTTELTPR